MIEDSGSKHNFSRFLLKVAHLLEPSGCKTVGELVASGVLPEDTLMSRGRDVLMSLSTLDYVALRTLASVMEEPEEIFDDESIFPALDRNQALR